MKPITITLQKIKDAGPCTNGWATVLKSKGGTKADFAAEFPLTDVIESNRLDDVLWCLRCLPEHNRIWRKYAVWCARQVEHLMTDQRSKNALDVADRHADGLATDDELAASWAAAWEAAWEAAGAAAGAAAGEAAWAAAGAAARVAAGAAARVAPAAWAAAREAARVAQKQKLTEVLTAGEWK
jgi:hypothetical protein